MKGASWDAYAASSCSSTRLAIAFSRIFSLWSAAVGQRRMRTLRRSKQWLTRACLMLLKNETYSTPCMRIYTYSQAHLCWNICFLSCWNCLKPWLLKYSRLVREIQASAVWTYLFMLVSLSQASNLFLFVKIDLSVTLNEALPKTLNWEEACGLPFSWNKKKQCSSFMMNSWFKSSKFSNWIICKFVLKSCSYS